MCAFAIFATPLPTQDYFTMLICRTVGLGSHKAWLLGVMNAIVVFGVVCVPLTHSSYRDATSALSLVELGIDTRAYTSSLHRFPLSYAHA